VKGKKEVCDPLCKGKHYKELESPVMDPCGGVFELPTPRLRVG
jgi:hypothetical protein